MNATIRSEKIESTEVDGNLAAVSEVEAGIATSFATMSPICAARRRAC